MSLRELDAARIVEPGLRNDYLFCRELNSRHGKTYFLATRLLPPRRRPAVHALYGFARWADDIVDTPAEQTSRAAARQGGPGVTPPVPAPAVPAPAPAPQQAAPAGPAPQADRQRTEALLALERQLLPGLRTGHSEEPVIRALAHTARTYRIQETHFTDFMASMRMDLEVTDYPDYAALERYMHGSAAVIGLQMLPVLGTVVPRAEAEPHAAALGVAFQLTNFLRDVGEDLDRGRVYLPADLLAAHGVDRELLYWSRATGRRDIRIHRALVETVALTRGVYRRAAPGIAMLDPVARPCIETAFLLYAQILDSAADADYPVVHRRVAVPGARRAAMALRGAARVTAARTRKRLAERRSAPTRKEPA
ncbi:phytoene/squalene synthase family protein [Streptomyces sp. 549]|uniref:phytoene/squalene synthase family protein n=1 Tax=Streptomyces sp. 549 TaxID=3049076 RepID=UPI0024C34374|nr:phytoene/squalene synthase family protein [Streptomyces sp. 549]MDK1474593.1 phytoene/squalene synthase family protein [Streptomyces sp. 549]